LIYNLLVTNYLLQCGLYVLKNGILYKTVVFERWLEITGISKIKCFWDWQNLCSGI